MPRPPTRNEFAVLRREGDPANGHTSDNPVYHQLKKMVIDCSFLPGEPLPVAELGDRFRVSGTPVREALNRLRAEALILSIPHKGFFAKGLDLQEIGDLYRLGFLLIRYSIQRYPLKCAAPGIADLPLAWVAAPGHPHRCRTTASTATLVEGFYRRVVAVSQNEAMMSVLENFIDRTHYARALDLQTPERADEITDRFHSLAQSLRREDTDAALAHLERLLERKLEMKLSLPIRNLRAIRAEASH
jgi:DNA-binding GntR family transcriptional regulator